MLSTQTARFPSGPGGVRLPALLVRTGPRATALVLLVCGALVVTARSPRPGAAQGPAPGRASGQPATPTVEEIVGMTVSGLPAGPVFVGLAQVVVPPGVRTGTVGTNGPRLLAIEAGTLTVAIAERAEVVRVGATPGPTGPATVLGGEEVVLGPGDRLSVAAGGVRELRNDAARPTVFLDAALFPSGADPITTAFTTPEGVSFQLLTGGVVGVLPPAPLAFGLRRVRLGEGAELSGAMRRGPAVVYVESGSFDLVPTAGEVWFGRAAAPAAASTAGALRPVAIGRTAGLTAGAAAMLATGSAVAARNSRGVPAVILLVEVVPAA